MLIAAVAIRVGVALGHFTAPESVGFTRVTEAVNPEAFGLAATLLSILFTLNLLLATFNLLPFPPLDGHAGVTLLMPRNTALRFMDWVQGSSYASLGLLLGFVIYGRIFRFLFPYALGLLYPGVSYSGAG